MADQTYAFSGSAGLGQTANQVNAAYNAQQTTTPAAPATTSTTQQFLQYQPPTQQSTPTQTPTPTQQPTPPPVQPTTPTNTQNGQTGTVTPTNLVGTRPSASNPNVTEYYNTQTGQGFSNPQALSAFANQQMGMTTTPQNVFDNLQKAFQSASGTPPQTQGEASSKIDSLLGGSADATANKNALNFLNSNLTIQDAINQVKQFLTPTVTNATLQTYINQMTTDQSTLSGLKTDLLNIKNVMSGTTSDIRSEIQAAGGFATESQVAALSVARNQTLLKQATLLQDQVDTATQQVQFDHNLLQDEKDIASTEFSQNSTILNAANTLSQQIQTAQKDGLNTLISSVGISGLVNGLMNADPTGAQLNSAAKILGMTGDQLKQAGMAQEAQNNLKQFKDFGVTSPYVVNSRGEVIDTQTGLPFSSPQEFMQKTGMTLQQANAKKMIAPLADVTSQLDQQAKLASINASNASAASSGASAAKSSYELQYMKNNNGMTPAEVQQQNQAVETHVENINAKAGDLTSQLANHKTTWGAAFNELSGAYPDLQTSDIDKMLHAELYRNPNYGG